MEIPYTLIIDLARPLKSNTILISEGDTRSRCLKIILMNNGKKLDMKDVQTVTIKGVKADDTILFGDCAIVTDAEGQPTNTVTYVLPSALADLPGRTTYTLTLNSETAELITTPEFYTQTKRQLYDEDDYLSESDLSGFRDCLTRSLSAAKDAKASKDAADESAAQAAKSEEAAKQYEELIKDQINNDLRGPQGADGKSAYETACEGGFTGSQEEWLASLKGEKGDPGNPGEDGKSAYEAACEAGFTGTEEEWLASLKGEKGDKGDPGSATGGTGAITELESGYFMMSVSEEGHLLLTHNDNDPQPPLSIADGKLIYTIS